MSAGSTNTHHAEREARSVAEGPGFVARCLSPLQFLAGFLWTVGWICVALPVAWIGRRPDAALWIAHAIWAPGILRIARARLQVLGEPEFGDPRGTLVVANHQSALDIPALFIAVGRPLRFFVKGELQRVPFLAWYISTMGMVFVDRSGRRAAAASVDRSVRRLEDGQILLSFPEGTRGEGHNLRAFKRGTFVAALRAGVPVLPAAVSGAAHVLPPRSRFVKPGVIRVAFAAPIETVELGLEDRRALADEARSRVAERLRHLEEREAIG